MTVRWLTAFLDRPAADVERATVFWLAVTSSTLSPWRGEHGEFATLVPGRGDPYLRVQRVADGAGGCHLDVHADDVTATVDEAVGLGALVTARRDDVVVLMTPGGSTFCIVDHDGESVPPPCPPTRTLVDQLCLDVAAGGFAAEGEFWTALTGWPLHPARLPGFSYLERPGGIALRLMFQRRLDDSAGHLASAHLDFACDDVEASVAAHEVLGARVHPRLEYWVTMLDPVGLPYCLTRRTPDTGALAPGS